MKKGVENRNRMKISFLLECFFLVENRRVSAIPWMALSFFVLWQCNRLWWFQRVQNRIVNRTKRINPTKSMKLVMLVMCLFCVRCVCQSQYNGDGADLVSSECFVHVGTHIILLVLFLLVFIGICCKWIRFWKQRKNIKKKKTNDFVHCFIPS